MKKIHPWRIFIPKRDEDKSLRDYNSVMKLPKIRIRGQNALSLSLLLQTKKSL